MGCFSWFAQDSNDSIIIYGCGTKQYPSMTHYMWDNTGRRWREDKYEGDGMFGEKDYYVLLAEMNNTFDKDASDEDKRDYAFEIYDKENIIYPNLTCSPDWTWKNEKPKDCPYQGWSNGKDYVNGPIGEIYHLIDLSDNWNNGEIKPLKIKKTK
jgi:hypothetical protein